MRNLIASLLRYRPLMIVALVAWIVAGFVLFLRLDIEAYPDPSPPLVEVITQNPSWSAEEMEQQVTVPVETALFGIPHLEEVRSISIFGLSDVKMYFSYGSDYYWDRQEVLNRLQLIQLPSGLSPQLSPWSPVGEIYRYQLYGPAYSLNELKATQAWFVTREIKQVSGIIDVTSFGGSTRQYIADIDPQKLLQFNVTLPQVVVAVGSSNANAGGNYLTMGSQNVNVRGLGLLHNIPEMQNVLITTRNGVPVYLRDVAEVKESFQPRLGQVGINHGDDAVEGDDYDAGIRCLFDSAVQCVRRGGIYHYSVIALQNQVLNLSRLGGNLFIRCGKDICCRHNTVCDRFLGDNVIAFQHGLPPGIARIIIRKRDTHGLGIGVDRPD